MKQKIIVLTGPTASGKTKLSIQLAKKYNAEIICADSRIVYKDLDIVSAKPTAKEQDNVVHHLIDIKNPTEDFSAGDFVELSQGIINSTEKNIIICGGTWFYIKALLGDLALPKSSKNKELRDELEKLETSELWEKLNKIDPKRASEIHFNNKDKIIRSIEMCEALNMPISQYKREENKKYDAVWFMPELDRKTLYDRINTRVDIMMDMGLYQEFQRNMEKYPSSLVIKNTIGYREFIENNNTNVAVEKIKQHTRNFAKRQMTYFRNNDKIQTITGLKDIVQKIEQGE